MEKDPPPGLSTENLWAAEECCPHDQKGHGLNIDSMKAETRRRFCRQTKTFGLAFGELL